MSQTELPSADQTADSIESPAPKKGGKALKIVGWCIGIPVGLFALLMLIGMLLPSTLAVERSIVVEAAPYEIHPFVEDLKRWDTWSPWSPEYDQEKFGDLSCTYEGPKAGEGAIRRWTDSNMPDGFQKITFSDHAQGIKYDLQFGDSDPMKCEIRYQPADSGTKVVWTARGDVGNNPIDRWIAVLMKPAFEKDYDTGLERLKTLAEKAAAENRKKAAEGPPEGPNVAGGPEGPGGPGGPGGPRGPGGFGGRGGPGGRRGGPGGGFNPQQIIERIMQRDKNKDGKLSKDELDERGQRLLQRADEDKDGMLSRAELVKAFSRPGGRRGGGRGRRGGGGRPRGRGPGGNPPGERPPRPPLEDDDASAKKRPSSGSAPPVPAKKP